MYCETIQHDFAWHWLLSSSPGSKGFVGLNGNRFGKEDTTSLQVFFEGCEQIPGLFFKDMFCSTHALICLLPRLSFLLKKLLELLNIEILGGVHVCQGSEEEKDTKY
jgi:hypothetical protein